MLLIRIGAALTVLVTVPLCILLLVLISRR